MHRVSTADRLPALPWRSVAWVLIGVPSVLMSGAIIALLFLDGEPFDWWTFEQAAARALSPELYAWTPSPYGADQPYAFRYSPLFAIGMAPFTFLGLGVWRLLHLAVLAFLPWRVALLVLIFPPFWFDVQHGNVMTFAFVAAWLAIHGNRWGMVGFFTVLLLVPRPLMLPIAAWLFWQRPESRLTMIGFGLAGLATLAWPGYLAAILTVSEFPMRDTIWPARFLGWAWAPIGLGLAAFLTWKGYLGLASVTANPYILPYYLVMALLDVRRRE